MDDQQSRVGSAGLFVIVQNDLKISPRTVSKTNLTTLLDVCVSSGHANRFWGRSNFRWSVTETEEETFKNGGRESNRKALHNFIADGTRLSHTCRQESANCTAPLCFVVSSLPVFPDVLSMLC